MNETAVSPWWRNWKLWTAAAALIGALGVFLWLRQGMPRLALFWLFGLGIGAVLQRSRFCFVSAISNNFLFRDTRLMEGVLIGLFIATIGFAAVMYPQMPQPGDAFINSGIVVTPFGWHLALGGVIFGFGMLLAGGCIVGNLYRIGEGGLSALTAFLGVLLGMGILQFTWPWWWNNYISKLSAVWLPSKIGWAGAILLTLGVIAALYMLVRRSRDKSTAEPHRRLSFSLKNIAGGVFKKPWPLITGGIILGLINILMLWQLDRPWTVTGELMTWAQGLFNFLHLPPPPFNAVPGT
jgi:uncharacterized membrane protein YedE/YeeE